MKILLLISLFCSLLSQDVVVETDTDGDNFSFFSKSDNNKVVELLGESNTFFHKREKSVQVIYEDGNYYVYSFSKKVKNEEKESKKKKRSKYRVRKKKHHSYSIGNGNTFFFNHSGYTRKVVPEKFVSNDFVVTAENIKEARLEEIKSSKMDNEEQEALIEAIESTSFESKARELSYLVNIIKDFKNKGKVIKK